MLISALGLKKPYSKSEYQCCDLIYTILIVPESDHITTNDKVNGLLQVSYCRHFEKGEQLDIRTILRDNVSTPQDNPVAQVYVDHTDGIISMRSHREQLVDLYLALLVPFEASTIKYH